MALVEPSRLIASTIQHLDKEFRMMQKPKIPVIDAVDKKIMCYHRHVECLCEGPVRRTAFTTMESLKRSPGQNTSGSYNDKPLLPSAAPFLL